MRAKMLKIFCDLTAEQETLTLLKQGVAPHEIIFPAKRAASVLSKSGPDPALADADIAFGQPDAAAILQASKLRWLHLSSAGYTRFDTPEFRKAAAEQKLIVTNSSVVYAEPCAEHVLAFMLAQARKLPDAIKAAAVGDFSSWLQLRTNSRLLRGETVLLLGFGSIARHLVALLRPFGMEMTALRRNSTGDEGVRIISKDVLLEELGKADHVVNILPASPASDRFVSSTQFAAMKKGAIFYNIGRGATVDQDALAAVLNSGHLAAAWLDVTEPEPLPPDHPLLAARNIFITPHLGGGRQNELETLVRHFLENFRRFLQGTPLHDRIM
jgi:phosphoglycerate dehydrogenase-like enzyme